jgi:hypothetical protein
MELLAANLKYLDLPASTQRKEFVASLSLKPSSGDKLAVLYNSTERLIAKDDPEIPDLGLINISVGYNTPWQWCVMYREVTGKKGKG